MIKKTLTAVGNGVIAFVAVCACIVATCVRVVATCGAATQHSAYVPHTWYQVCVFLLLLCVCAPVVAVAAVYTGDCCQYCYCC